MTKWGDRPHWELRGDVPRGRRARRVAGHPGGHAASPGPGREYVAPVDQVSLRALGDAEVAAGWRPSTPPGGPVRVYVDVTTPSHAGTATTVRRGRPGPRRGADARRARCWSTTRTSSPSTASPSATPPSVVRGGRGRLPAAPEAVLARAQPPFDLDTAGRAGWPSRSRRRDVSAGQGSAISRRTPSEADRSDAVRSHRAVVDPVEQRDGGVGQSGGVVGRTREREAAGERDERPEPHLEAHPDRRAGPRGRCPRPRARASRRTVLDHLGPVVEVGLERLLPAVRRAAPTGSRRPGWCPTPRPSRWNHGPIVGPSSAASARRRRTRRAGPPCRCRARPACARSWRRSPTAPSVGRSPITGEPGSSVR